MTPDEVLQVFDDGGEGYSTPEVAAALGISKPGAWRTLDELASQGLLERQSGSGMEPDLWTLTEIGAEHLQSRINSF